MLQEWLNTNDNSLLNIIILVQIKKDQNRDPLEIARRINIRFYRLKKIKLNLLKKEKQREDIKSKEIILLTRIIRFNDSLKNIINVHPLVCYCSV